MIAYAEITTSCGFTFKQYVRYKSLWFRTMKIYQNNYWKIKIVRKTN